MISAFLTQIPCGHRQLRRCCQTGDISSLSVTSSFRVIELCSAKLEKKPICNWYLKDKRDENVRGKAAVLQVIHFFHSLCQ